MNIDISVSLPLNYLGETTVSSKIVSAYTNEIFLVGNPITEAFPVRKPLGISVSASSLISFGVDPSDSSK